jgi:hypothetical protein
MARGSTFVVYGDAQTSFVKMIKAIRGPGAAAA